MDSIVFPASHDLAGASFHDFVGAGAHELVGGAFHELVGASFGTGAATARAEMLITAKMVLE